MYRVQNAQINLYPDLDWAYQKDKTGCTRQKYNTGCTRNIGQGAQKILDKVHQKY